MEKQIPTLRRGRAQPKRSADIYICGVTYPRFTDSCNLRIIISEALLMTEAEARAKKETKYCYVLEAV